MYKKKARIRRAMRTRMIIKKLQATRLVVNKTSRHIYAQIIDCNQSKVLVSSSTLEKGIAQNLLNTGNISSAMVIGEIIAKRAIKKGITNISFDRSGFKYHGRIKALADSARKNNLKF